METTLPLPFLIGLDLPLDPERQPDGLTRDEVSVLGCPFFEASSGLTESSQRFLERHGFDALAHLDASRVESHDEVVSVLDWGTRRVFVQPERLAEFAAFGSRVVPVVSGLDPAGLDLSSASEHGLLIKDVDLTRSDLQTFVDACREKKVSNLYLKAVRGSDSNTILQLSAQCCAIPILPSTGLTTSREDTSKTSLACVLWAHLQSDRPDGLVPTVVCSESGVALGLAYSSEESIAEALRTQTGVYQSRKRGLWIKGATSGDTQELVRVAMDCDSDTLRFVVRQKGRFCHLDQFGCFGHLQGIPALERTLRARKAADAPPGSYTARLFSDEKLLRAKIMEEAEELCDAKTKEEAAFEAADLIYFALTRAVGAGASLADIEANLDAKSLKVKRRPGDAKGKWAGKEGVATAGSAAANSAAPWPVPESKLEASKNGDRIRMRIIDRAQTSELAVLEALRRPSQKSSDAIMSVVNPIIADVRKGGDQALLSYTHKFDKANSLTSPVLRAPYPPELMALSTETMAAIDTSFDNIRCFHEAQQEEKPLLVETMPGVVCSRFARPIERVGLYVPGGTAVLPSTALMLGVPAMVAGCRRIVFASPPRADGSVTPEIVYVAHKVGAEAIVLAGGAQAVAALAYGTESVPKVDKILGPGNQFVTAAKMVVSNDTNAGVAIDMPAGPSEELVVADDSANLAFVASDLLSQAEHGVDSQVVLLAAGLSDEQMAVFEAELHTQAMTLPRVDIVRGAIEHSVTVRVRDVAEAMRISNLYAPEHLTLQVRDAERVVGMVENAGSVFIGQWTPESVGDYSAGVNHSLPTYGYARQYSGVNLGSFVKHITSSNLTPEGLRNVGNAVMQLAEVEKLEAHRRAVAIRLEHLNKTG